MEGVYQGSLKVEKSCIIMLTKHNMTLSNSNWSGRDLNSTVLSLFNKFPFR